MFFLFPRAHTLVYTPSAHPETAHRKSLDTTPPLPLRLLCTSDLIVFLNIHAYHYCCCVYWSFLGFRTLLCCGAGETYVSPWIFRVSRNFLFLSVNSQRLSLRRRYRLSFDSYYTGPLAVGSACFEITKKNGLFWCPSNREKWKYLSGIFSLRHLTGTTWARF